MRSSVIISTALALLIASERAGMSQVGMPLLTVENASRCAAALRMVADENEVMISAGDIQTDQYLETHPTAPAMDLKYDPKLSDNWSRTFGQPVFVYGTHVKGRKAGCWFVLSVDGLSYDIMRAAIFPVPKKAPDNIRK